VEVLLLLKKRFSKAQIVAILQEAEAVKPPQLINDKCLYLFGEMDLLCSFEDDALRLWRGLV
jgi:hypothetical protein